MEKCLTVRGGVCLKAIRQRKNAFAVLTGIGIILSALILACSSRIPEIPVRLLLAVSIPASVWLAVFWVREYRRLQAAMLIIENQILHIYTAVTSRGYNDAAKPENAETVEVFVSYFGILLDSKVIKFNQDKIFLKTVEIGRDFISLSYGTDRWIKNIRLLRSAISDEELENIIKQFRYETGIIPTVIN
jgi:hypothetical protein